MKDIRILDACCGSRMFWFDKKEPHTTYMDRREEEFEIHKKKINVKPDIVADFRDMPFDDVLCSRYVDTFSGDIPQPA